MKQIKTILVKVEQLEEFDKRANNALAEGWTLVKREVLQAYDSATCIFHRMLYAELEREIVEEKQSEPKERECGNCAHYGTAVYDYPCTVCRDCNKWEADPDA
jgi:hypothetical protein